MRTIATVLLLVASSALAQMRGAGYSGGITRGNFLPIPTYSTASDTGTTTYYVDPTGSDGNPCTTTGTGACLTIQGAINKIPKLLRQQVTVSIAAGTYTTGFLASGFTVDNGRQQTSGGLLINGTLANSSLATGTATGTATSGTAGSGSTFGTLTDSGQSWTVNDLRGRFVFTSNLSTTPFVISSNTATSLTIEGTWTAPTGGVTTYTIQDAATIISGLAQLPATPLLSSTQRCSMMFANNEITYRGGAIVIQNIQTTATSCGLEIEDGSSYQTQALQLRPSSSNATGVFLNTVSYGRASLSFSRSDILMAGGSSSAGINDGAGVLSVTNSLIRNTSSGNAIQAFLGVYVFAQVNLFTSELLNFNNGLLINSGLAQGGTIANSNITCATSAGAAFVVGSSTTNASGMPAAVSSISNINVSTCGTGLQVVGPASADVTSLTGSVGTTGFAVYGGGLVTFSKSGTTVTAGTNEVNLDSGALTAAFADVTAGSCVSSASQGSRVCGR